MHLLFLYFGQVHVEAFHGRQKRTTSEADALLSRHDPKRGQNAEVRVSFVSVLQVLDVLNGSTDCDKRNGETREGKVSLAVTVTRPIGGQSAGIMDSQGFKN
jgi:hypothetical protein